MGKEKHKYSDSFVLGNVGMCQGEGKKMHAPWSAPQQQKFSFKYHPVVQCPCLISDTHSVMMFKKAALRPMQVPTLSPRPNQAH